MNPLSPLRYPGGKQLLANVLARLIAENGLTGGTYAEPYAGGSGAALSLLFSEHVGNVLLNDADPCISAMWTSILNETYQFSKLIRDTPLTVKEWKKQKLVYSRFRSYPTLAVGFATFYLNRTNRSGIIKNAGPIGGLEQNGRWTIEARFNRKGLIKRIERIALYRNRISFDNLDAVDFIDRIKSTPNLFAYLDPHYFIKGKGLYLNHYLPEDHASLSKFMADRREFQWVMSYDRTPQTMRLYTRFRQVGFTLSYSATERRTGNEILILSKGLQFPREWRKTLPASALGRTAAGGDP